jgi:endonuclease/exonuclease/phosphatase family metal-dependent hydrolase
VRTLGARSVVVVLGTAMLMASMVVPSGAASRVGAPWVVAASPTSVTLDWPNAGARSYRVYSFREGGGWKRSVRTSSSERKVTGLRAGRMYCFQVARDDGSGRSRAFCHTTPTRTSARSGALISVVTFNVCGTVCGRWSARRAAVLRRILESGADVIALQEATRRIPELTETLFVHGFDLVSSTQNEAVFARRGVLRLEAFIGPGCRRLTEAEKEAKFPAWDKQRPHTSGARTYTWDETLQRWVTNYVVCNVGSGTSRAQAFGTIVLPNGRTAAWASLLHVASGRNVTVASVHLSPGKSSAIAERRGKQARALTRVLRSRTAGPKVVAGDFNSSRARGRDLPRRMLQRADYVDAYDQATTFSRSYVSSSNGLASKPRRSVRFGDHIDRIFVPSGLRVSDWAVIAPLLRGRNVRPMASDHSPIRVTVELR